MIDCLLLGFNEGDFNGFCRTIRALGEKSAAWRDIRSSVLTHGGKYLRALDLFTALDSASASAPGHPAAGRKSLHNMDFLAPAILYLGSFLKKNGCTFDYVNLFQQEKERLREKLAAGNIGAVVITTTLYVTPEPILEIVSFVRRCAPQVKIVVGGPYILKESSGAQADDIQRLFKYLGADFYVISSEGEQTLVRLLAALRGEGSWQEIANCAWRDGEGYRINPQLPEENRLEDTPIDYRAFPRTDLGELVSVRTAISCPFSCAFCGFPRRAGRHRAMEAAQVERELDSLHQLGGVSTLTFLDDTFNVPRSRFKEILRMMIRRQFPFKWNCFLRCDHADAEIVELMGQAGCEGVFLGVESGNDQMLKRMNKSVRRHNFLEILPLLKRAGIVSHMSLIVGFPGENEGSVRDTISLVQETEPDFFRAQLWYCDPMTPIWSQREQYGIRGSGFNWSHNTMDSRQASDWVEEMFMTISRSIWLPQHGFELWSVFYLQRMGMSREQVKRLLTTFNAAVKGQMMDPEQAGLGPGSLANLRAACAPLTEPPPPSFAAIDERQGLPQGLPHPELVERYAGDHYRRASSFWQRNLTGLEPLFPTPEPAGVGPGEGRVKLEIGGVAGVMPEISRLCHGSEPMAALALFTALLSRVYGERVVAVTVEWEGGMPLPLPFAVEWEGTFTEQLRATEALVGRARELAAELAYFQGSAFHSWAAGDLCSRVQVGFSLAGADSPAAAPPARQGQGRSPLLELALRRSSGKTEFLLCLDPSLIPPESAAQLAEYFTRSAVEVARNPDIVIGSLLAGEERTPAAVESGESAEEQIDFKF